MKKLAKCEGCGGFVPGTACPHCGKEPGRALARRIVKGVAGAVTGGAVAVTLMACYGTPPGENRPPTAVPVEPTPTPQPSTPPTATPPAPH